MPTDINKGDRVSFFAREYGPGEPLTGRVVRLTGTVFRPVWGRGPNVSIRSDDGRTFCRLLVAVSKLPSEPPAKAPVKSGCDPDRCRYPFGSHSPTCRADR